MSKESRRDHAHWRRIKRFFKFERCNEVGARKAATWLNVADRRALRAAYDCNLTAASRNALDVLMLAAADDWLKLCRKQLADAEALRQEMADAECISGREMTAVASMDLPATGGGTFVYHFQPYEKILQECLNEEYK